MTRSIVFYVSKFLISPSFFMADVCKLSVRTELSQSEVDVGRTSYKVI